MSVNKDRRISHRIASLLTSGSMAIACAAAGVGGVLLTPARALADNECTPVAPTGATPDTNTTTADTFVCNGSYSGITYTANGNLTVQLQNAVTTTANGVNLSGGAFNVIISRPFDTAPNTGDAQITDTSGAGVSVSTTTGSISVSLNDNDAVDSRMNISGVTAGVDLQKGGTSALTFSSNNGTITASAGPGIKIVSGTGNTTISNGSKVTGTTAAVDVSVGGRITMTNTAAGALNGVAKLIHTSSSLTFNNQGVWTFEGLSTLGDPTLALGATLTNTGGLFAQGDSTIEYGLGFDTFNQNGTLGAGGAGATTLTLAGLETWNNAGTVIFGVNEDVSGTDGEGNDRIVGGTAFLTGSGFSTLMMDVDFGADQGDCLAAVSADCLDLRGGGTLGSTTIFVKPISNGAAERIVLVDVNGGSSAAAHFTLSPNSPNFAEVNGAGTVDGGIFRYALSYDATERQHALVAAAPGGAALELALMGRAASEPLRTAAGMWRQRQADLRGELTGSPGAYRPGVWLKAAGNFVDDQRRDALSFGGSEMFYNTSYAQETRAFVGGVDVLRMAGEDSAWVLGLTAGKVDSSLDFGAAASEMEIEGGTVGAYGSLLLGRAFLDVLVSGADLNLTYEGLGGTFETPVRSIGYQVEGGYRLLQLNEGPVWLEPVAALSHVSTDVDAIEIGSVTAQFDDASSTRAAVGLRLGGELAGQAFSAGYAFTGRVWKEVGGDNALNLGDIQIADDGMDNMGELGIAVSLFTLGNRLSAHLAYNLLFKEDYQNTGASVGLRYSW